MMIITKPNRNKGLSVDRYIQTLGWLILSVLIGVFGLFMGCIGLGIINF